MDKQQYERDFLELFETNGYRHIQREALDEVEAIKEQMASNDLTIEQVYLLRGQIMQLRTIANLEYLFKQPQFEEVPDASL